MRDHPAGRWTVVHLLNACGTDHSGLFADGLVNYFADAQVSQDERIIWLTPTLADAVVKRLISAAIFDLHEPHYSVIARPDSKHYQNSTAWVLEVLAAARLPEGTQRHQAQALLLAEGHTPDIIEISYGKRVVGGLFSANAAFTDHPLATRLSGKYPVVTVRSILRYLQALQLISSEREWRGGRELTVVGPA